jgi:hypothetical protein
LNLKQKVALLCLSCWKREYFLQKFATVRYRTYVRINNTLEKFLTISKNIGKSDIGGRGKTKGSNKSRPANAAMK